MGAPEPGLVLHYNYLWRHEHRAGLETSPYSRPTVVVVAVTAEDGVVEVVLAPITHLVPGADVSSIEIPPTVKAHLGLDDHRSWIVTDDLNICRWPSPDAEPVPNGPRRGAPAYGMLPPKLYARIKAQILAYPVVPTSRTD